MLYGFYLHFSVFSYYRAIPAIRTSTGKLTSYIALQATQAVSKALHIKLSSETLNRCDFSCFLVIKKRQFVL